MIRLRVIYSHSRSALFIMLLNGLSPDAFCVWIGNDRIAFDYTASDDDDSSEPFLVIILRMFVALSIIAFRFSHLNYLCRHFSCFSLSFSLIKFFVESSELKFCEYQQQLAAQRWGSLTCLAVSCGDFFLRFEDKTRRCANHEIENRKRYVSSSRSQSEWTKKQNSQRLPFGHQNSLTTNWRFRPARGRDFPSH